MENDPMPDNIQYEVIEIDHDGIEHDYIEHQDETTKTTTVTDLILFDDSNIQVRLDEDKLVQNSKDKCVQVTTINDSPTSRRCILEIITTDVLLNSWTGIPSFNLLTAIEKCVNTLSPELQDPNFTIKQKILLVLVKLKTNLSFVVMSSIFNVSAALISQNFELLLPTLSCALNSVVECSNIEDIRPNLPTCFKQNFLAIRSALDTKEEAALDIKDEGNEQLQHEVNGKLSAFGQDTETKTAKFLICLAPNGNITYVSKAYSGKATDSQIFTVENLLDKFDADNVADMKKNAIETELIGQGVKLVTPSFSSNGKTEYNTQIAPAKYHIDTTIDGLNCFAILSDKIDHSLLKYLDDILVIVSAITNLTKPVKSNKNTNNDNYQGNVKRKKIK